MLRLDAGRHPARRGGQHSASDQHARGSRDGARPSGEDIRCSALGRSFGLRDGNGVMFIGANGKEVCGGSRARAWATTGDALGEDPLCSWRAAAAEATVVV